MKSKKIIFTASISIFIAGAWIFFKIFEPVSTDNIAVNFSKRIAAETGNIVTKIYDPYEARAKKAVLGPVLEIANSKDLKSAIAEDNYLKAHLNVIEYGNKPIIRSGFEFDYQPYDEKKLKGLREKYKIDEKISSAKREFDKIILIKEWLNSYMKFGIPHDVDYNFNALDILERAEKGDTFFCSEYSTTYIELLASIGVTARYVGLFKGHAVSEVWSDDYDKWIVIDPTYNIYYEENGIPLNALELHNAWVNNKWKDIKVAFGNKNREIEKYPYKLIDYYADFFIRMRNDWLTNLYPRWHAKSNSIMNGLEWSDAYTKNDMRIARETNKKEDMYWQLDQVYVKLAGYKTGNDSIMLRLCLDTVTPNFDKFEIMLDEAREIRYTNKSAFEWRLAKGLNVLYIRPVNKFGLKGKPSIISINYY